MPSNSCIWTPQLNVCFYSAAPSWQASKGVGDRKERKKSEKFQFPGGGTPYGGLYGVAPPERGIFFKFQVYERVGILLVEVYERVETSVIWACERAQKG